MFLALRFELKGMLLRGLRFLCPLVKCSCLQLLGPDVYRPWLVSPAGHGFLAAFAIPVELLPLFAITAKEAVLKVSDYCVIWGYCYRCCSVKLLDIPPFPLPTLVKESLSAAFLAEAMADFRFF